MLKIQKRLWQDGKCPLLFVVVIAFAVITACGFVWNDDYWMSYGIHSLNDVFKSTWDFYFNWGGGLFSVAMQYVFCGLLKNHRIWFVIANTLFFILLIIISSKLISKNNNASVTQVLSFALLFWFLCPSPSQTVFWAVGSIGYLWATVLVLAFLVVFEKYKDSDFGVVGKFALLFFSITMAGSLIPCVSICGAFVLYYLFHIKEFKGNVVPLVVGFALGSIILVFAPGNFVRVLAEKGGEDVSLLEGVKWLVSHPFEEVIKYKALWLFVATLLLGYKSDKESVRHWIGENAILLLSLAWSIIAFSVVFRPANRALFYTETMAVILMLRFCIDNKTLFVKYIRNLVVFKKVFFFVLGTLFLCDAVFAVKETLSQRANNEKQLERLAKSGGIVALDRNIPAHRMAYASRFPEWTWESLADEYGLDSVHVYPWYCQDKFYNVTSRFEDVYIDFEEKESLGKDIKLIVRVPAEDLKGPQSKVVFTIKYDRPRKWYKQWLDKWRNYKYERIAFVERYTPDTFFDGYSYYIIWFRLENAKNLKTIEYDVQ